MRNPARIALRLCCLFAAALVFPCLARAADSARATIVDAILADSPAKQRELIASLAGQPDDAIPALLDAWRKDSLFVYVASDGSTIPVQLVGERDAADAQTALRVSDGQPLLASAGQPLRLVGADLTAVEHTSALRRAMKAVLDLRDLGSPDLEKRLRAIQVVGFAQDAEKLPILEKRLATETEPRARTTLREAIALIGLKAPTDAAKLSALAELKQLHTLASADLVKAALRDADTAQKPALAEAARAALRAIGAHRSTVNFLGTLFRGASLGSILLVVALGLAITFGLMGVINMAHGEMIAVGAYTTYIIQNLFGTGLALSPFGFSFSLPGLNASGWGYQAYFFVALPLSFLAAALVGIALERGVIRFLYRRPLESLLATWGVSLVLQQLFRLIFGANNVQVSSPAFLSGNWTVNDIILGWNRVFVIGFAALIVVGVWLVLTRTALGLLIRAVMQNRAMASCMGVRTSRVNMLTFGLGSGLAGLAGAFLSQIGNVGPSLGQNYIVDCFMTVVVGGVGNIAGTVLSATGIGFADQSLQQILGNPVLGKILVLVAIILFLQWRPAGLFVTRSRSLD
ncbi:MAG TPA: urea ABC transporter permease subunit UrtB [Opitutaceae bacterium]|nr:urea ABC transporter permease subunit UrtB [Opitutaceae bacterium]